MMGASVGRQDRLFYEFDLEAMVPVDHLLRISVPQLFFAGSRDRLSPLAALQPVVASLPAATLREIDDGDHGFKVPKRTGRTHDEVLDELVAVTTSWLDAAR